MFAFLAFSCYNNIQKKIEKEGREFMINIKGIMRKKVVAVLITVLLQNNIYTDIKAVEVVKEITDQAAIIKKGNGTINLYKVIDESGRINYRLTAVPSGSYKLEDIDIDGGGFRYPRRGW